MAENQGGGGHRLARRRGLLASLLGLGLLLLPAAPAEAATPTATASDTTDLVHGQPLTVHGEGWDHQNFVTVLICADLSEDDTCEVIGNHSYRPGLAGRFTIRGTVDAYLDVYLGPFDCRVVMCHLSVWSEDHSDPFGETTVVEIPVTFDPNGPGPVRRAVDASPTTDLVDGSRIAVQADGFDGDGHRPQRASLVACRISVEQVEDCDPTTGRTVPVVDGSIDARFWVPALLGIGGWWDGDREELDCRAGGCALLIVDGYWEETGEGYSEAGLVPLAFDPEGPLRPDPTATVTPAAGLDDGQRVTVDGASFNAGGRATVRQCAGPLRWDGLPHRCLPAVQRTTVAEDGTVRRRVTVREVVVNENGRRWNCLARPCWLVVEQRYERPAARARIQFA